MDEKLKEILYRHRNEFTNGDVIRAVVERCISTVDGIGPTPSAAEVALKDEALKRLRSLLGEAKHGG